jgi:hypothetical protein
MDTPLSAAQNIENVGSQLQDTLAEAGGMETNMASAAPNMASQLQENLTAVPNVRISRKGKKRRRASSGGVQSEYLIFLTLWRKDGYTPFGSSKSRNNRVPISRHFGRGRRDGDKYEEREEASAFFRWWGSK